MHPVQETSLLIPAAGHSSAGVASAFSTARVRSRTPSFEKMLDVWFFTVPALISKVSAISLLLSPAAMSRRISVSRSVRGSGDSRLSNCFGTRSSDSSSRSPIAGWIKVPPPATMRIPAASRSDDTSFKQKSARTGLDAVEERLIVVKRRQQNDWDSRAPGTQPMQRFDAIHARHPHVEQHHIRFRIHDYAHGLRAVAPFGDHADVGRSAQGSDESRHAPASGRR
jgi:hypothetical protein